MKKKISSLPFNGTPEQEAQLKQIIAENKNDPSMLMGVMQKAQDIYGYLPIEVQKIIADGMGVPLEKVYGVATFYAQFALSPKGSTTSLCVWVPPATLRAPAISLTSCPSVWASVPTSAPPTVSTA